RDGSIDWLCAPRFDSRASFAALLGTREHGRWLLAPRQRTRAVRRRYRDQTLVLETDFEVASGAVRVIDCMPLWPERTDLVRIVECLRGRVPMRMELIIRCGYGIVTPMVRRLHVPRPLGRCRRPLADHAQGADVRAHRRHGRRRNHFAARAHRRRAELGLPLLLAARRDDDALCVAPRGLSRRGTVVAA